MTHPLPDKAVEAGARFLCAEMSDDFREGASYWRHVAQGFLSALAAEGLCVVPKQALDWLHGEAPDAEGKWFGDDELHLVAGRPARPERAGKTED